MLKHEFTQEELNKWIGKHVKMDYTHWAYPPCILHTGREKPYLKEETESGTLKNARVLEKHRYEIEIQKDGVTTGFLAYQILAIEEIFHGL